MIPAVDFQFGSFLSRTFLVFWLCAGFSASAGDKEIRLRNEHILTKPANREALPESAIGNNAPRFGLYLIQFEERLDPTSRAVLEGKGVDLLHYIPDDAF